MSDAQICNVNCRYCYLPDRSFTSPAHDLTPLERIARLRERVKWEIADEAWSARSDDDEDDWADWEKTH